MEVSISPKMQKFVEQKVLAGHYRSIDEVIEAGLATLERQEQFGDFKPGELDQLIAEGQRDIERGNFRDGEEVFEDLRKMSEARRAKLK